MADLLSLALQVFTYVGMALTAFGAWWALTHELYAKGLGSEGRHLTAAGKLSALIIFLGLFTSINTKVLDTILKRQADNAAEQRRQAADRKQELADLRNAEDARELQRTLQAKAREIQDASQRQALLMERRQILREIRSTSDIILAAQPLRRLQVLWKFPRVLPSHREAYDSAVKSIPTLEGRMQEYRNRLQYLPATARLSPSNFLHRHQVVYPWMQALATGDWSDEPVLLLISLDDTYTSILALGRLPYNQGTGSNGPGTVEFLEDFSDFQTLQPQRPRSVYPDFTATVGLAQEGFAAYWDILPYNLDSAIFKGPEATSKDSSFPAEIRVMAISSVRGAKTTLAAGAGQYTKQFGMAAETFPSFGDEFEDAADFRSRTTLILTPNSLRTQEVRYRLFFQGSRKVGNVACPDCPVALWRGRRDQPGPPVSR